METKQFVQQENISLGTSSSVNPYYEEFSFDFDPGYDICTGISVTSENNNSTMNMRFGFRDERGEIFKPSHFMNWFVNTYGDRNKLFRECYIPAGGKKITVVLEGDLVAFASTYYHFAFRLEKGDVKKPLIERNYINKTVTIPAGLLSAKDSLKLNIDYDKIVGVAIADNLTAIGLSLRTPERYYIGGRNGIHSDFLTLSGNRPFGEKFYKIDIPAKGTYIDLEAALLYGAIVTDRVIPVIFELERPFKL